MKTSEVLAAAADYHAEHGSCKGTYQTEDGRVCLLGAIHAVLGVGYYESGGELMEIITTDQRRDKIAALAHIYRQMHEDNLPETSAFLYNDREDVSGEDVTLLLKRSAERARLEESGGE